jgi:4-hydroxy-tetrahydrodipicolinate synthase
MKFSGSFVPLITPFDRKGRLDKKTVVKLVNWHIAEGSDGIVCSATTGEGPCLSDADRKAMADLCIQTAAGRVPVIVSTGINDTKTSVRYTEIALKLGAAGCLAVTPYYNKPSQRGCILHFTEIAQVGLPVILYHNPPRAVVRLTAETIFELSQVPNIVAIKESSHDLELIGKVAKFIDVFAGDDDLCVPILKVGAVGSIATSANLFPRGWKKMVSLCLQKKWDQAELIARKYLPFIRSVFLETNPQGIKFSLSWLGKCEPILRLPMILPMNSTQKEIKKAILELALPQFKSDLNISLI